MEGGSGEIKLPVRQLNASLGCTLCKGYFRDAHTIPDCLHTFCKACIYRDFARKGRKESKCCPTCKTSLGPLPWTKIIFDRTLQGLVDKIFPQFIEEDQKLAEQFAAGGLRDGFGIPGDFQDRKRVRIADGVGEDEEIEEKGKSVSLRVLPAWGESVQDSKRLPLLSKPLIRALINVKVSKIQKFIQRRLANENVEILPGQIDILFASKLLDPTSTLDMIEDFEALAEASPQEPIILTYRRANV